MFAPAQGSGHDRGVKSLRAVPALLLTVLLTLGASMLGMTAAHGEDPVLVTEYVTDRVAALSPEDAALVQEALLELQEQADLQLFVVFTDTFSGQSGQNWADVAAVKSALGVDDVLLAVAVEDGEFGLSVEASLPLTSAQVDRVEAAITQQLGTGSAADLVVAAAAELQTVTAEGPGGSVALLVIIIVVAIAAVLIWLFRHAIARRRPPRGSTHTTGS